MATLSTKLRLSSTNKVISDLPSGAYLVHATNCLAAWGAGFAKELSGIFPAAYCVYKSFCNEAKAASETPHSRWPPRDGLTGRCLIIPPQPADTATGAPAIFIVCLFTSYGYGRPNGASGKAGVDPPKKILAYTETSLAEFRESVGETETEGDNSRGKKIYSPRFNSGFFGVPWQQTETLIIQSFSDWQGEWCVLEPPQ